MNIRLDFSSGALKKAAWKAAGAFEKSASIPQSFAKKFEGKEGEAFFSLAAGKQGGTIWVGLGKKDKYTREKTRGAAARALGLARSLHTDSLAVDAESFLGSLSGPDVAAALTEGARLAAYRFDKYKSKPAPKPPLAALTLVFPSAASAIRNAFQEAETISQAVYFTRDLANEPPNVMTPPAFARAVQQMARRNNLSCRILGKKEIQKLGMGGILAVSQGSSFPPQLVILENKTRAKGKPVVLVGKGITFDTGGISIKPSGDMDKMKFDMCGAAAVMGALKAAANLKLNIPVVGIAPVCENMPGSTAQRPGDIIRISNGKTVEVLNTDAEGRLILADALSYAKRYEPRALVDIATLTGACAATFADHASGLMGTDPDLVRRLREAGERTGERCWELPLWDEYADLIRATYADIQNISKRNAGTITAGLFLKEFAGHAKSWAHLDIAGTAWNNGGSKPLSPIGATGVGVRLLVELIKSYLRE